MRFPFSKHVRLLSPYIRLHPIKVLIIGALIAVNVIIRVVNPLIIKFYLDSVENVTSTEILTRAATLFIVMAVIQEIVYLINVYFSSDLSWRVTNDLRFDLFRHTVNLDMGFHNRYKPGEMIERVDGDVNALSTFLSNFSLLVISNILLISGIVISIAITNLFMGGIFLALIVLAFTLMIKVRLFAIKEWENARESTSKVMGFIEERLGGTEEIRANGGEQRVIQRFHDLSKNEYNTTYRAVYRTQITQVVSFFVIGLGMTMIYAFGVPMVNRTISLGTLYLFTYYFQILLDPIFQILRQIQQLQQADASIERVNMLMNMESTVVNEGKLDVEQGAASLEFRNLTFKYAEEPVLRDVNFSLAPRKRLGLIGRTGSGKSTIARLLFRLYDTEDDNILINGRPIKEYDLKMLRRRTEMVTQEVELFNASIRDNVSFFNKSIGDEQLTQVLTRVGLDGWLKEQSEGLDTRITKTSLSAGQAQLLAFARAFLADPSLVILDEASSRLDPSTEDMINLAMSRLLDGRTAIVIAHRLETLATMDDILLLDNGEVVEYGPREELRKRPDSRYSQLLEIGIEEVLS